MLLSLGLTADAAAAHRHEFSNSISSSVPKGTTPRPRPSSNRLPMPLYLDIRPRPTPEPPGASSFETSSQEPRTSSEDERDSLSDSEASRQFVTEYPATPRVDANVNKSTRRSKTSYHLAHPPPTFINRQRLLIRPRLLLQLQRISGSTRPSPTLDVLPSTILPPRLARRFPAFFRGKDRLGPDDLVIVNSEDYKSSTTLDSTYAEETDGEISESRNVVATICQRRKEDGGVQGKAEVYLHNGVVWEATPLPNGGYEFSSTSEGGLRTTARWVCRPSPSRKRSDSGENGVYRAARKDEKRFGFSLINPNVRRHPIIASLSRTSIDVFDTYPTSVPSTMMHSPLVTPQGSINTAPSMTSFFDSPPEPSLKQTDEDLRTLILVTGIWVAFREGWCQGSKPQGPISPASRPASTTAANSGTSRRSTSSPVREEKISRSMNPESSPKPQSPDLHMSHTRTGHIHRPSAPGLTLVPERRKTLTPRRAHSTGTASKLRVDTRNHVVDHRDLEGVSSSLSSYPDDPKSVRMEPTVEPVRNEASKDVSVRTSIPPSALRRAQSSRVSPPGDYDDSESEAQLANAATKKRWGRLKRLLSFVKKGPNDR